MKSKVFNIVVVVVISLLTITTVYQGIVIDDTMQLLRWTRSDLQATEAELDELGAYMVNLEAADNVLMRNLSEQLEVRDKIYRLKVDSVWEYLYWDDYESYSERLDELSRLEDDLIWLEKKRDEWVAYREHWVDITADKWEPK